MPDDVTKRPSRLVYIDALNVVSIMLVIFLHLRTAYWNPLNSTSWWAEAIPSGIGMVAVPIFFMISGTNNLRFLERMSPSAFLKRRFTKVLIPYLAWIAIYLVYENVSGRRTINSPKDGFWRYISGYPGPQFWYLEVLMGIYLLMPFLSLLVTSSHPLWSTTSRSRWLVAATAIMGIGINAFVFLVQFAQPTNGLRWAPYFVVPMGLAMMYYVCVGHLVASNPLSPRARTWLYVAGFGSYLGALAGGVLRFGMGSPLDILTSYTSLTAAVLAPAIFVAFSQARVFMQAPSWLGRALAYVANNTFGIFLTHYLVIFILEDNSLLIGGNFGIFANTVVVYLLTLTLTAGLRFIPAIRKWLLP